MGDVQGRPPPIRIVLTDVGGAGLFQLGDPRDHDRVRLLGVVAESLVGQRLLLHLERTACAGRGGRRYVRLDLAGWEACHLVDGETLAEDGWIREERGRLTRRGHLGVWGNLNCHPLSGQAGKRLRCVEDLVNLYNDGAIVNRDVAHSRRCHVLNCAGEAERRLANEIDDLLLSHYAFLLRANPSLASITRTPTDAIIKIRSTATSKSASVTPVPLSGLTWKSRSMKSIWAPRPVTAEPSLTAEC